MTPIETLRNLQATLQSETLAGVISEMETTNKTMPKWPLNLYWHLELSESDFLKLCNGGDVTWSYMSQLPEHTGVKVGLKHEGQLRAKRWRDCEAEVSRLSAIIDQQPAHVKASAAELGLSIRVAELEAELAAKTEHCDSLDESNDELLQTRDEAEQENERLRAELAAANEKTCKTCCWSPEMTKTRMHFTATKDECLRLRSELKTERLVSKVVAEDLRQTRAELAAAKSLEAAIERLVAAFLVYRGDDGSQCLQLFGDGSWRTLWGNDTVRHDGLDAVSLDAILQPEPSPQAMTREEAIRILREDAECGGACLRASRLCKAIDVLAGKAVKS